MKKNLMAAEFAPHHFRWEVCGRIATVTIDRPEKKNPLTLESYEELGQTFRKLAHVDDVRAVVVTGAEGNFCSGGDVKEIIGPLVEMEMPELIAFTRMTGELIKSMRACPQPIIAAIDGICAGAGACVAMAADMRLGTPQAKVAFLFARVGLAGCDMGACAMLPRIIGQGRASELLYTGRSMSGAEAERWGFFNNLYESEELLREAHKLAKGLAMGPTFAHAMTKNALHQEWDMGVDEAIEAEAEMQAICMQTKDFRRAYQAFMNREKPKFEGN
mgnify:CR=1 FL=1